MNDTVNGFLRLFGMLVLLALGAVFFVGYCYIAMNMRSGPWKLLVVFAYVLVGLGLGGALLWLATRKDKKEAPDAVS